MNLKDAANKYNRMQEEFDEFNQSFLNEMGTLLINLLTESTPSDTGELKKSWEKGIAYKNSDVYYIPIVNTKEYASYVEDGHRQTKRFLPGEFKGGKFVYDTDSETGIMLSDKWIEGKHMYRINSSQLKERLPTLYHAAFSNYMNHFRGNI